jgi:hypothetical protein
MNLPISLVIENKQRKKPMGTTQEEIYQRKRIMRFFFMVFVPAKEREVLNIYTSKLLADEFIV